MNAHRSDGKGRHTTTYRELHRLPSGAQAGAQLRARQRSYNVVREIERRRRPR